MNNIALVSGRYIKYNPYRELSILDELIQKGFEPCLLIPLDKNFSRGYPEDFLKDKLLVQYRFKTFLNNFDLIRKCISKKYVFCGADKQYTLALFLLRLLGKKIISFDSAGGTDQCNNFANIACVKSSYHKKYFYKSGSLLPRSSKLQKFFRIRQRRNSIKITGSILYDYPPKKAIKNIEFRKKYDLSENEKIIVLFPKTIYAFDKKIDAWCRFLPKERANYFKNLHKELNLRVLNIVKSFGCTPLIKIHPLTFNTEDPQREIEFWESKNAKIIDTSPYDTFSMYKNMSLGISLNSQSSFDVNYFQKPFIYIEDANELPPWFSQHQAYNDANCFLQGPSSNWHSDNMKRSVWCPAWVGYLSKLDNLYDDLHKIFQDNSLIPQYEEFISEFWFKSDGQAAKRIVDSINDL